MKSAWSLQQPAVIMQSCWGCYAQQHRCHETDRPHCWTETISAFHPGSQSAARRDREKRWCHLQLVDDISQDLCHTSLSFLQLYVTRTEFHKSTPACIPNVKIHTMFLIEILDFPYLPFITKNRKYPALNFGYVMLCLFNQEWSWVYFQC